MTRVTFLLGWQDDFGMLRVDFSDLGLLSFSSALTLAMISLHVNLVAPVASECNTQPLLFGQECGLKLREKSLLVWTMSRHLDIIATYSKISPQSC